MLGTELYFEKRLNLIWRASIICKAILQIIHPTSIIDIGCSVGEFVKWFSDNGIPSLGLDVSKNVLKYAVTKDIVIKDITTPYYGDWYDLALCFEVVSILDFKQIIPLIENISKMSDNILIGIHKDQFNYTNSLLGAKGYRLADKEKFILSLYPYRKRQAIKAIYNSTYFYKRK